jgi:hypothetical protein
LAQELRSILFHHDPGFEIQAGGKTKVLVKRAGVAIDAAVLAAAIGIYARFKADVGAVVIRNNLARAVAQELRARVRILFGVPIGIGLEMDFFEAVGRIRECAAMEIRFQFSVFDAPHSFGPVHSHACGQSPSVWLLALNAGWNFVRGGANCKRELVHEFRLSVIFLPVMILRKTGVGVW